MSAHFDGGVEIAGRRLREVEVTYVDDPTLDMGAEDSDDCPASPPPTYYLRVREEKRRNGQMPSSGSDTAQQNANGREETEQGLLGGTERGGDGRGRKMNSGWAWRYVNVESKALLVWDRRGGKLLRSIPLKRVESLLVIPDEDAPASILEISIAPPSPAADSGEGAGGARQFPQGPAASDGDGGRGDVLVVQARSRRETLLWAKVLQKGGGLELVAFADADYASKASWQEENVELMTKRRVPLKNLDEETTLSDVQQLAKLLTHQLSELQKADNKPPSPQQKQHQQQPLQPPLPPPQQQQGH